MRIVESTNPVASLFPSGEKAFGDQFGELLYVGNHSLSAADYLD
jgi:hypothetical protein